MADAVTRERTPGASPPDPLAGRGGATASTPCREASVHSSRERGPLGPVALWLLVAVGAAVLAVALGGAAPQPPPPGLPDPGPVPGWTLPLLRLASHAAALVGVGTALRALLADTPPHRALVSAAAVVWAASSLAAVLVGLSEVVGRPVTEVLDGELLGFYGLEVPQGRALLVSAALALLVAVAAPLARGRAGTLALLLLALAPLVPPLLEGHAAGLERHRLAQVTLVVHVLAAVLWVGGLAALTLLRSDAALLRAARRFSSLALLCAAALGLSGVVSSSLRVDLDQLVTTGYGVLLLVKAAAFGLLVAAGARHRGRTLPRLAAGGPQAFRRLAGAEVALMAAAYGLAVALSRTPLG